MSFLSEASKRKQPIKPFLKGEILLTVRLSIEHLTLKNKKDRYRSIINRARAKSYKNEDSINNHYNKAGS